MKRIACFCIPAHGHTNPMLPVVAELVSRGNQVRFYSFGEFEEKIRATGATFVSCDEFLPELSAEEEAGLRRISSTEMAIQDMRITRAMDAFLSEEFASFRPDVVYTDSVCFWGKLNADKHRVPMVVSTSTFAFNQMSSQYQKLSGKELADMILGLPRVNRELRKLEPLGYRVKSFLSLVNSDNETDSVVYTSKEFQPCVESFSDHFCFVGPSVFSRLSPQKEKERPLVYVSMGTVINERPDLYRSCIEAVKDLDVDLIISCGKALDPASLGELPERVKVYPYVDQLEILSRADTFITHCGMNSVSESLYMATPMLLYPQTSEQHAVARRVAETGAGLMLEDDSAQGIRAALEILLADPGYARAAMTRCEDFRSCSGPSGAAEFIENAPHTGNGIDPLKEMNRATGRFQVFYWSVVTALIVLIGLLVGWKYSWIVGVAAGPLSRPLIKRAQERYYRRLCHENAKRTEKD